MAYQIYQEHMCQSPLLRGELFCESVTHLKVTPRQGDDIDHGEGVFLIRFVPFLPPLDTASTQREYVR